MQRESIENLSSNMQKNVFDAVKKAKRGLEKQMQDKYEKEQSLKMTQSILKSPAEPLTEQNSPKVHHEKV